ncbi:uncharacterized protein LOC109398506 isoform X2 [Aedes albopictus]|uniref:Neuropeptide-like 1 n=1 Tax=Aedes albopictus TaxID=7160 RepID=A0ABM1YNX4_AEDAL
MGNFGIPLPPKLFLRILMLLFLVVHNANSQYAEGNRRLKPCELETLLRDLTYPEEGYEMHAAALRNQLRHILEREPTADSGYQSLDDYGTYDNSGPYEDKRSYRSLLREGATFGKRNLGSLARAGLLRTPSTDYLKRSIATLAKNGQLPASREPDSEEAASAGGWNDEKRNLASARASGYMLNGKRNIASLARKYELPGKRNIQSLLRTGMLPSIAPKRNMQSLARDNSLPHFAGASAQESKRNIQTLVRDWNLPRQQSVATDNEKRNIQSLKHSQGGQGGGSANGGGRKKRELYYEDETLDDSAPEILEPVYQSAPLDYEELMEAMNEAYTPYYNSPVGNHVEEKRYLGSLARAGILHRYHRFYKRTPLASFDDLHGNDDDDDNVDDTNNDEGEVSHKRKHGSKDGLVQDDDDDDDNDEDYKPTSSVVLQSPQKRHLGSIIRSGWMPSFRPSRTAGRFSRSGRARSHIVEFYSQPERLRQPIAGVCRRCDGTSDGSGFRTASAAAASSPFDSWGGPGLQSTLGSAPPRVTALHWRRFREPSANVRRRTARGVPLLRQFQ